MPVNTYILVEGISDKQFLEAYLKHLGFASEQFTVDKVDGRDNLRRLSQEVDRAIRRGEKVLVIFDANGDPDEARTGISETLMGLSHSVFLFPDDESEGNLETLLERIANPFHVALFECFEAYQECMKKCGPSYIMPTDKEKIYAYRQALNKLDEKDHFSSEIWDFDNEALEPLKNFLS